MAKKERMSIKQYALALLRAGKTSFALAPSAAYVRIFDSIVQAVLPIITTVLAALTTTALVDAYAGDAEAGLRALMYVVATSLVSVLMLLWNSISNFISQKTRYIIESSVEDKMMLQFGSLPYALYDDKETVDLHDRARRFSYFFSYVFETLGQMLTSTLTAVGAMIALLYISPWLTLAVVVAVLPGFIVQLKLARDQANHWEGNITQRRRKYNMGYTLQDPHKIAELRLYGVVKKLIAMYGKLRDKDEKERLEIEQNTRWKQLAADVGESIVELGALVWVVLAIIAREQPVGQFVYVQQMVSRALVSAGSLGTKLGQIDEDLANIIDYQKFMELPTSDESGLILKDTPNEITLQNVTFTYPKTDAVVLDDISMTITKSQHIAIVGENGAGKSTLLKILLGLYEPTSGKVLLDGVSLQEHAISSWHSRVAILSQDFVMYYFGTIKENIQFGDVNRPFDSATFEQALHFAEFEDVVSRLPAKENSFIERWMGGDDDNDEIATELSGGQQQRLALARNFYRDAPVVILDEPTSAIDALAESRIFKRLFKSDKTIITVSHRLTTVEKADVIYMLQDGKVVEQGTHKELVARRGAYFTMFQSQLKSDEQKNHPDK